MTAVAPALRAIDLGPEDLDVPSSSLPSQPDVWA